MVALVDDSDFDFLNQWKWKAFGNKSGMFYAERLQRDESGKRHHVFMHRIISNAPKGIFVDHEDHCTLNNQKYNLRLCSHSKNHANELFRENNTSGFKGVRSRNGRWTVCIRQDGHAYWLGTFDTVKEAALKYDAAAIEKFGEFALTNEKLGLL